VIASNMYCKTSTPFTPLTSPEYGSRDDDPLRVEEKIKTLPDLSKTFLY